MPPIIPSAFPSTGRVPSPSIEIENSRMEETISPNTFTRPSCEREPRRKTISIWPSRKFHRCALYHELVSFRSVFFPFLSLSPYTLLFPTTTKREIAASTRTFKLAAIRFLSHGLHLLTPRVPRFFSLFLSSHFSFIFSANQEPTLDLGYGIRGVEWKESLGVPRREYGIGKLVGIAILWRKLRGALARDPYTPPVYKSRPILGCRRSIAWLGFRN